MDVLAWKIVSLLTLTVPLGTIYALILSPNVNILLQIFLLVGLTFTLFLFIEAIVAILKLYSLSHWSFNQSLKAKSNSVMWFKYFLSFRLQSASWQTGILLAGAVLIAAPLIAGNSTVIAVVVASFSALFIFYELVTTKVIAHKIFVYCDLGSLSFLKKGFAIKTYIMTVLALMALLAGIQSEGLSVFLFAIPLFLLLYLYYDGLATMSAPLYSARHIVHKIVIPASMSIITALNPVIGAALFCIAIVWMYRRFRQIWMEIPYAN